MGAGYCIPIIRLLAFSKGCTNIKSVVHNCLLAGGISDGFWRKSYDFTYWKTARPLSDFELSPV